MPCFSCRQIGVVPNFVICLRIMLFKILKVLGTSLVSWILGTKRVLRGAAGLAVLKREVCGIRQVFRVIRGRQARAYKNGLAYKRACLKTGFSL